MRRRLAVALAAALALPAAAGAAPLSWQAPQTYTVSADAECVAVGEVTGDGRTDALLTTGDTSPERAGLYLFPQLAAGGLGTPVRLGTQGAYSDRLGVAVADLDGDGANDVAVAERAGLEAFYQRGGTLAQGRMVLDAPDQELYVVAGDVDGDGTKDVVVDSLRGVSALLRQPGGDDFRLLPMSEVVVSSLAIGSLHADGRTDLAATQVGFWGMRLYQQYAPRHFLVRSVGALLDDKGGLVNDQGLMALGDATGDGRDDAIVSGNGRLLVYPQRDHGLVAELPVVYPMDGGGTVVAEDISGDGRDDVVVDTGGGFNVFVQRSGGGLEPEQRISAPAGSGNWMCELAVGDVTGDGRPDLVTAQRGGQGLVVVPQAGAAARVFRAGPPRRARAYRGRLPTPSVRRHR